MPPPLNCFVRPQEYNKSKVNSKKIQDIAKDRLSTLFNIQYQDILLDRIPSRQISVIWLGIKSNIRTDIWHDWLSGHWISKGRYLTKYLVYGRISDKISGIQPHVNINIWLLPDIQPDIFYTGYLAFLYIWYPSGLQDVKQISWILSNPGKMFHYRVSQKSFPLLRGISCCHWLEIPGSRGKEFWDRQ